MRAEVVLQGLTKQFGQTLAVNRLYLHIQDQELVVLVGPSGCGKTTTLRLIAGQEEADSGEIFIGGRFDSNGNRSNRSLEPTAGRGNHRGSRLWRRTGVCSC
ncbi:MAG TPA: ABC transporter ATP-binding protein [Planctomycetes bacterium]|nr:ABC transporter ATP-binding protein [Planctomycetaceae bacterium]HIN95373.1 ABC transporter ATP-binding protein [Planctomycetota bacterium]